MFLLSCEKNNNNKKKKKYTHINNTDTGCLLHVYVYILVHTWLRAQNAIQQHTQVICTYCSACHTSAYVQIHTRLRGTQLKDQHHLEVKIRHRPCLTNILISCLSPFFGKALRNVPRSMICYSPSDCFLNAIY